MANAAPKTTSNAAAVIISRIWALEIKRKIGFINHLPATTNPTTAPSATAMDVQLVWCSICVVSGVKKAMDANNGTMDKSSKIKVEITR